MPGPGTRNVVIWVIPIIDLLVICTAVAIGRGWLLDGAVRRSLGRMEPDLQADLTELARAQAMLDQRAAGLDTHGEPRPSEPVPHSLAARLDGVAQVPGVLATLVDSLVTRELAYWGDQARRLAGPCLDLATLPPQPARSTAHRLGAGLLDLLRAQRYGSEIAHRIDDCTTPIPVPLTDDDLRFRFASAKRLEMTPEEQKKTFDRIRALVDDQPDRRWIYIAGHTDYIGGAKANYPLSEDRARYVANIIRAHLDSKQQVEGCDYRLYIERR